jgi:hypothetical protein
VGKAYVPNICSESCPNRSRLLDVTSNQSKDAPWWFGNILYRDIPNFWEQENVGVTGLPTRGQEADAHLLAATDGFLDGCSEKLGYVAFLWVVPVLLS